MAIGAYLRVLEGHQGLSIVNSDSLKINILQWQLLTAIYMGIICVRPVDEQVSDPPASWTALSH